MLRAALCSLFMVALVGCRGGQDAAAVRPPSAVLTPTPTSAPTKRVVAPVSVPVSAAVAGDDAGDDAAVAGADGGADAGDHPAALSYYGGAHAAAATAQALVGDTQPLTHCLWYADSSQPPVEGAGSMVELDERITALLHREALVVGRVRLAARGCPVVSAGVVLVRDAADRAEDGASEGPPLRITGDDADRGPVVGARGDERRDGPWPGPTEKNADCTYGAPPSLYLFRAVHSPGGAVSALAVAYLWDDACGVYGHDLQFGDLDGDGTTELRVESLTGGAEEMTGGNSRAQLLWIFDLASFRPEFALNLGVDFVDGNAPGLGSSTTGSVSLRDLDGDGARDVIVRRFIDAVNEWEGLGRTVQWTTEVHAYAPATDTYVRAQALDARVTRRR